ncbi:MAG: hypothetical protein IH989_08085 [Planctomycetes bacterium]|nr:hypothetical protein [Planctomycetota bacterium]
MTSDKQDCPLCDQSASHATDLASEVWRYECDRCGCFLLERNDEADFLQNERWQRIYPREKIGAVLREMQLMGRPKPFLLFRKRSTYSNNFSNPVHIDDLLALFPSTIPERIERSFCCLLRAKGSELRAGQDIEFSRNAWKGFVPFALDERELKYFLDALSEYGWISHKATENYHLARITPKGWEKYHELTASHSDARNPVFVAMWFGKKPGVDRSVEMKALFEGVIKPACLRAGWDAVRADSREHNEPIMGKVLDGIRKAPFVIAELTDNNAGVFYEAGFALGLGKEVIYCRHTDQRVHFDVSAINQVVWKDNGDLAKRLYDRILETQEEGPFVNRCPEGAN